MGFKSFYIDGKSVKSMSIDGKLIFRKQEEEPYALKFVAEEPNSGIKWYRQSATGKEVFLEFSTDGGNTWQNFILSREINAEGQVIVPNVGDVVYVRASSQGNTSLSDQSTQQNTNQLKCSGAWSVSGDIRCLLDQNRGSNPPLNQYGFSWLFSNSDIIDASNLILPYTAMKKSAYDSMFAYCRKLVSGPRELPATTLSESCYNCMFEKCQSLVSGPRELPATVMSTFCYRQMFDGCSSLVDVPEILPSRMTRRYCYNAMFRNTKITRSPLIQLDSISSSQSFSQNVLKDMFSGCSSLTEITIKLKKWPSSDSTGSLKNWVSGVSPSGTFYCPSSLPIQYGVNRIPSGWEVVRI